MVGLVGGGHNWEKSKDRAKPWPLNSSARSLPTEKGVAPLWLALPLEMNSVSAGPLGIPRWEAKGWRLRSGRLLSSHPPS